MIRATTVMVQRHGAGAKGGLKIRLSTKSRGGLTTKIVALIDALGNLARFVLQIMKMRCGHGVMVDMPRELAAVLDELA